MWGGRLSVLALTVGRQVDGAQDCAQLQSGLQLPSPYPKSEQSSSSVCCYLPLCRSFDDTNKTVDIITLAPASVIKAPT